MTAENSSGAQPGSEPAADAAELVEALLDVLRGTSVSELDVEWQGVKVRIRRQPTVGDPVELTPQETVEGAPPHRDDRMVVVPSAHVGIFRRDAEADLPQVGDLVEAGARIGEVEVLGVRNVVTAPANGILAAVLVDDEAPVEYGQPLAMLRPRHSDAGDHGEA